MPRFTEKHVEHMMQEKPKRRATKASDKIIITRCENCSAYSKKTEKCRLPTCLYRQGENDKCKDCPYKAGICNICYRQIIRDKEK